MSETSHRFWTSVPSKIHNALIEALSLDMIHLLVSLEGDVDDLQSKYNLIAHILQQCTEQAQYMGDDSTLLLHALGLVRMEQHQYPAAESNYRSIISRQDPSRPDLAAQVNLALALNEQRKYAEAEVELRQVWDGVQSNLGPTSLQALGCRRMLIESLAGQGKKEEARHLYSQTEQLVDGLSGEDKESETEALQAVKSKLGQL